MADLITCSNLSVFTWDDILRALFSEEVTLALAGTGQYAFRIVQKTAGDGDVIACSDKDTFKELFFRSIEIADDNKAALRVVITDRANGASLRDVPQCVNHEGLELMARLSFIYDSNGDVAVNLANIT